MIRHWRRTRSHIWLQIDDLGGDRYLAIAVELGCLLLLVAMLAPAAALAQTEKDISSEGIPGTGYKYGVGSIKDLPPSQPLPPGSPSPPSNLPYRTPHPDALREYQQRMLRERLEQIKQRNFPIPPPPGSNGPP